ncbi:hypothetical protein M9H77_14563 [Catharanthus roseus]|uniref:Uncharacterized protein n=1 Tax=Catharanthus roseus TaxID=4058 RepID=A0ACC0BNN8_CATRO|nr:hypothetical protein M9H77_14563 [Catharanthus roseus]
MTRKALMERSSRLSPVSATSPPAAPPSARRRHLAAAEFSGAVNQPQQHSNQKVNGYSSQNKDQIEKKRNYDGQMGKLGFLAFSSSLSPSTFTAEGRGTPKLNSQQLSLPSSLVISTCCHLLLLYAFVNGDFVGFKSCPSIFFHGCGCVKGHFFWFFHGWGRRTWFKVSAESKLTCRVIVGTEITERITTNWYNQQREDTNSSATRIKSDKFSYWVEKLA